MRKLSLFFALAFIVQVGYETMPILAQQDAEVQEIKKVVENFLEGFVYRDLNLMMNQISINYTSRGKDGNIIDYAKIKSIIENRINTVYKKYINYSISNIEIVKSDIRDNLATIWVKNDWKAFNLDTNEEDSGKRRRFFSLTKENGSWKITNTQNRRIQEPKKQE